MKNTINTINITILSTLSTLGLLFSGCANNVQPTEPIVITKVIKESVPIACTVALVVKPSYMGLNDVQKLYTFKNYVTQLENRQIACDINTTK